MLLTNKRMLTIMGFGAVAMTLIAFPTFADSLNQSGQGNVVSQNSNNSSINSNNTSVNSGNTSGSNNHLSATGGKASSDSHSASGAWSSSTSGSSSNSGASSDNSVSVHEDAQRRNPVSTAYAAPLVAAEDTCSGSTSVGGQAIGFGASFGSTWQDADCVRRKDARELHNMGQKKAALALMCQNPAVAKAMVAAGSAPSFCQESLAASDALSVVADVPERAR